MYRLRASDPKLSLVFLLCGREIHGEVAAFQIQKHHSIEGNISDDSEILKQSIEAVYYQERKRNYVRTLISLQYNLTNVTFTPFLHSTSCALTFYRFN